MLPYRTILLLVIVVLSIFEVLPAILVPVALPILIFDWLIFLQKPLLHPPKEDDE